MGKDLKGKELGIGIAQRKDGRYEARYKDRFGNRKSVYDFTLKGVRKKLADAVTADSEGREPVKRLTLNEWYDIWYNTYKKNIVKESTLSNQRMLYNTNIRDVLGDRWLDEISRNDIQAFVNTKYNYKVSYVKQMKILLHDIFQRAYEDEYISKNPVYKILFADEPKKEKHALSVDEEKLFLKHAKQSLYYELYVVALNTGMRIGEICALTLDDIDFKDRTINVNKNYYHYTDENGTFTTGYGTTKTKSSNRVIPMNQACFDALKRYVDRRNAPDNIFFRGKNGKPITSSSAQWDLYILRNKILNKEGIDISLSPHILRHTFATRCFERGIPPKIVQSYLGHSKVDITLDIYTHVSKEIASLEIEKIVTQG